MKHRIAVTAFAATLFIATATAEADDAPATGSRVWIRTAELSNKGELISMDDDVVILRFEGGPRQLAVPRSAITGMDVSTGSTKRMSRGKSALLGLAIGGGGGALAGLTSGDDTCSGRGDYFSICLTFTAGEKGTMLGILGGAAGALVGVMAGGDREKWQRVTLHDSGKVKVSLRPIGRSGPSLVVGF